MTRWTFLAAVVMGSACSAPPSSQQPDSKSETAMEATPRERSTEPMNRLVPTWKHGDTWQVQYLFESYNYAKVENASPFYEHSYWTYIVERADPETIQIVARSTLPGYSDEPRRYTFDPSGQLRSIEEGFERKVKPSPIHPSSPFVELDVPLHRIASDWPHFPIARPSQESFPGDLTQTVRRDGDNWSVTMRFERKVPGVPKPVFHEVEQTWEPGRPWWSSIRITYYDSEKEALELEGHVTRWGPEQGRTP